MGIQPRTRLAQGWALLGVLTTYLLGTRLRYQASLTVRLVG